MPTAVKHEEEEEEECSEARMTVSMSLIPTENWTRQLSGTKLEFICSFMTGNYIKLFST